MTGLIPRIVALIGRNLAPNRISIWLTVVADVTAALLTLLAGLDVSQTAGVVVALAAINAKTLMFLKGWQQFERALQSDQLSQRDHERIAESMGQVPGRTPVGPPKVSLPR